MSETRKLAAILVADVVGYSLLAGADEERTLSRLRGLRSDLIDPAIAAHHGRIVKRTGDGSIVEFRSVVDAARCAIEVQSGLAERNAGLPSEKRIEFRVGIHVGDVVEEADGDLMGDGVNIAARLEGVAEPGAICLSEDAYRQVKSRLDLKVSDLGETRLKNIVEPVRVYSLKVTSSPRSGDPSSKSGLAKDSPAPTTKPSIAVLPFANMSGDAEQEYFADGISEDIITALSKLSQLFVIARNSSFTFKGSHVHVTEVARSLGVGHVLEGSVRKSGNRVRITAQLIDAATGGHLWAERFDRDLNDIFAVQDDVTNRIVVALALNLSAAERQSIAIEPVDNLEAFDCFLRGRELFSRLTRETNRDAQPLLRRAIELAPGYTPALAFLAGALVVDYVNGWSAAPAETLAEAEKTARRAIGLNEQSPHALWALCVVFSYTRRYDEALSTSERAISFNPNFATAHITFGTVLHHLGRNEEALARYERGTALDPFYNDIWLYFKAQANYQLGRYPEAVALLKRRIERNPETDVSRVLLAAAYGRMGQFEEAREAWREALRVNPAYSLEHRRKVLPYKNPENFERVVEGLRKAGLPEE
jgi:adenylate cyclase